MEQDNARQAMPYAALLEDFRRHLAFDRGLSDNTCSSYARDIKEFLKYCGEYSLDPEQASPQELDKYLWKVKERGRLKPSSLFRKMESLRALYRFLAIENRLAEDPTRFFKAPHMNGKIPSFLTKEQVNMLLSYPASSFHMIRASTVIELFYATGMRISELINLRMESVDLNRGWVMVYGKGGKERIIPLHEAACSRLKNYLAVRNNIFANKTVSAELFVNKFGGKLSRVQIWKDIRQLGREAGLAYPLHPHLFRHTFASHLLMGGADLRSLQEMLGHASLSTTQIYTHIDKAALKETHSRHHPRS